MNDSEFLAYMVNERNRRFHQPPTSTPPTPTSEVEVQEFKPPHRVGTIFASTTESDCTIISDDRVHIKCEGVIVQDANKASSRSHAYSSLLGDIQTQLLARNPRYSTNSNDLGEVERKLRGLLAQNFPGREYELNTHRLPFGTIHGDCEMSFFIPHPNDNSKLNPVTGKAFIVFPKLKSKFIKKVIQPSQGTEGSAKDYFNSFIATKHSENPEWVCLRDFVGTQHPFFFKALYQCLRDGNITTFKGLPKSHSDIVDTFSVVNFLLLESKSTGLHFPAGGFPAVTDYTRLIHGIKWCLSTMLSASLFKGNHHLRYTLVDR